MVDADYCFTYIDVGGNGRASDSAIFRDSTLNIAMEHNTLGMPKNGVIVGDDAFPLRSNLLKPYSKTGLSDVEKIFNYRLSRARRVVENAFGVLVWRFRVFSRPIDLKPETIDKVIWATCSLHNWLRKTHPGNYLPQQAMPCTEEEWLQKSQQFAEKWNFPHCIGALDGKHVLIKAPKQRGSLYHNYEGTHSVVLMALADAEYKFQYINVGCFGRISDGGVFNACSLSNKLADNSLGIPTPRPLPGRTKPVPFVIVADDAFAMKSYIMKPYAFRNLHGEQRIFNYRLSRARRIIENAFGLPSARFRILRRPIELGVEKLIHVVSAICVLHNFLMTRSKRLYAPYGSFDVENHETGTIEPGEWRQSIQGLVDLHVNPHLRGNLEAKDVQREFTEYFHQEGEVPWQYKYILNIYY
ncbi:unnamed protein product [Acanthoscelides obtectus]|uniref:DDE Tnp4 domain-containing protein n=1 Tax=Acanthoscelides obtectus TaxID=200917 RepID=A0A9P0LGQ6_ACAOB|nr:unnamed protein product [Acanthoscelides obtectus]CAK1680725.1 Putative nuclease HARBI1 [Acanthoscelides obtectus]